MKHLLIIIILLSSTSMLFANRYYSADNGRFLERDPSGYVDGWNLYSSYYGVNGFDPYGLYACSDSGFYCHVQIDSRNVIAILPMRHLRISVECTEPGNSYSHTYELLGYTSKKHLWAAITNAEGQPSRVYEDRPAKKSHRVEWAETWIADCTVCDCIRDTVNDWAYDDQTRPTDAGQYEALSANSNAFVTNIASVCGISLPPIDDAPGAGHEFDRVDKCKRSCPKSGPRRAPCIADCNKK